MSEIRVNTVVDEGGTGAPILTYGCEVPVGVGITGAGGVNVSGAATVAGTTESTSSTTGALVVSGGVGIAKSLFVGGNISCAGTITYDDVTNIDSVGIVTARSLVDAQAGINVTGIITARSGTAVTFRGGVDILDAAETVSVGATSHVVGDTITLELDCANGTVFTHDGDNGQVGILSITNFPATKNSFHTVTLIHTQTGSTPSGVGNTTSETGIGTQITLTPRGVTGFTTEAQVGSGTSITCSTTAGDVDIISFGIHYNGGTNTDANSYKTFGTKNGDFRLP